MRGSVVCTAWITYPSEGLDSVRYPFGAGHARAVGAAIEMTVCFHAMANDLDAAVLANGGERVYSALKAVEGVRGPINHSHLKALVVLISAHLALSHVHRPFPGQSVSV